MNSETGHLVDTHLLNTLETKELEDNGYKKVPEELSFAAQMKLQGRPEAFVSLTSGGKLSKFAAKNRKAKRRQQKKSRKS